MHHLKLPSTGSYKSGLQSKVGNLGIASAAQGDLQTSRICLQCANPTFAADAFLSCVIRRWCWTRRYHLSSAQRQKAAAADNKHGLLDHLLRLSTGQVSISFFSSDRKLDPCITNCCMHVRAECCIYGGLRMELRFAQHTLKEVSKSAYHRLGQANIRVFSSQLFTCDPLLER